MAYLKNCAMSLVVARSVIECGTISSDERKIYLLVGEILLCYVDYDTLTRAQLLNFKSAWNISKVSALSVIVA